MKTRIDPDEERYCQICGRLYRREDKQRWGMAAWRELRTCGSVCAGRMVALSPIERFSEKFIPEPNSGCWLWIGAYRRTGYGHFFDGVKVRAAHRFSFEAFCRPLNMEELVCHKCDVRECVNPDHLFAGSTLDNMHDMHAKGRAAIGERHGQKRLTEEAVRYGRANNLGPTEFSVKYGVSIGTAHAALRGNTWRHIK